MTTRQDDHAEHIKAGLERDGSGSADGTSTVMPSALAQVLVTALSSRASDVHIDPVDHGVHVLYRIDGQLDCRARLDGESGQRLTNQVKAFVGIDPIPLMAPAEGRRKSMVLDRELDLRVAVTPCVAGEKITIRLLDTCRLIRQMQDLGLAPDMNHVLREWLNEASGACLVAGPTGSGKTTTLYAMLEQLVGHGRQIVTLEDPVEYRRSGLTQIQIDDDHGLSFAEGIKTMLRLDPDYLLLGEVRDAESARAAMHAAGSGRTLLTSLHGRDAVGAVTSLRNWGVEDHEINDAVDIVVAQRLVRKLCTCCREDGPLTTEERRWLDRYGLPEPENLWHARGCDQCDHSGFRDRVGVFEVWRFDADDYDKIANASTERTLRQHLCNKGHQSLLADGFEKAVDGLTTISELRVVGALFGRCFSG